MKRIRYIKNDLDPNIGFKDSDIEFLITQTSFSFPKIYLDFLKAAGERSNVLDYESQNAKALIALQSEFQNTINTSDFLDETTNEYWCFTKSKNIYYFFKLDQQTQTIVYEFHNLDVPINNGWSSKFGPIDHKFTFKDFINIKTDKKWGVSTFENIKKYFIFIISLPIFIPFYLYLKLKSK